MDRFVQNYLESLEREAASSLDVEEPDARAFLLLAQLRADAGEVERAESLLSELELLIAKAQKSSKVPDWLAATRDKAVLLRATFEPLENRRRL